MKTTKTKQATRTGPGRPVAVGSSSVVKIRLTDSIHRQLIERAAAERRTQREVISAALAKYFATETP